MRKGWMRVGCVLMCLCLLVAVAVSSACVVRCAGHHCTGEDCPVCAEVALAARLLRSLGLMLVCGLVLCALAALQGLVHFAHAQRLPVPLTLVGRKVRLND